MVTAIRTRLSMSVVYIFAIVLLLQTVASAIIPLSLTPPDSSKPILESFVSFSIEFSSFPDFAGNTTHPNTFSYNLLHNIGQLQGSNPIIRVGGNTQDYATFDAAQKQALIGSIDPSRSKDYPTTISIGPSFFDSYSTWPNTTFVHGFNLGKNGSVGHDTLVATVPLACKALSSGNLAYWQLGNEPDLYKTSAQGPVRPAWWNETDYVVEWLNKTRLTKQLVHESCPELISEGNFQFYAPSFGGTANSLNLVTTWAAGLDADGDVGCIDSHNYIGGATQPGVTLQGTLMNHSSTVASVAHHVNESRLLAGVDLPYILGETNSLYNEGAPGLSNSFGAALWAVDFNLYCAAMGIRRVHMHQGTNYRYASWQPVETAAQTRGTKAPYYANIMVASFLGVVPINSSSSVSVSVSDIDLGSIYQNAYATYVDGRLQRIAIVQMREFNSSTGTRPVESFSFQLPNTLARVSVQRLAASGSDAITGITFDGTSYNYELDEGRPVVLGNVTRDKALQVAQDGVVTIEVPWSSAAVMNLHWVSEGE